MTFAELIALHEQYRFKLRQRFLRKGNDDGNGIPDGLPPVLMEACAPSVPPRLTFYRNADVHVATERTLLLTATKRRPLDSALSYQRSATEVIIPLQAQRESSVTVSTSYRLRHCSGQTSNSSQRPSTATLLQTI